MPDEAIWSTLKTSPTTWNVAAGNPILQNLLAAGDANPTFQINGDGTINWGPGGATATDTYLKRTGSGLESNRAVTINAYASASPDGGVSAAGAGLVSLFGNGAVYLRPVGQGSGVGQAHLNSDGSWTYNNNTLSFFFGAAAPGAIGVNGDLYFNSAGAAGTTIYQKRAGAWVGIV